MISILVAGAIGLAVTLLGTPIAIRAFTVWGWGQRIREDGPHTHREKMGTPTITDTIAVPANFCSFVRPSERRLRTFMKSSRNPTSPNPSAASTSATPAAVRPFPLVNRVAR